MMSLWRKTTMSSQLDHEEKGMHQSLTAQPRSSGSRRDRGIPHAKKAVRAVTADGSKHWASSRNFQAQWTSMDLRHLGAYSSLSCCGMTLSSPSFSAPSVEE